MSWSASFPKPVPKVEAYTAIDGLGIPVQNGNSPAVTGAMDDQLQAAKDAAKLLLKSVPGPLVSVSMSGHANAVGWQEKSGFANDCISVSVVQSTK